MTPCARNQKRSRGIAAVELAVVMPILVILLVFPLYLGRYFYHYTIAQNAAQNAARYLSKIPVTEMTDPNRAAPVVSVANQIVAQMLAELVPGPYAPNVSVLCGSNQCAGLVRPQTVTVSIQILVVDIFFPTNMSLPVDVSIQMPYLGR